MRRLRLAAVAFAAGAATAYLFDQEAGPARRAQLRDQSIKLRDQGMQLRDQAQTRMHRPTDMAGNGSQSASDQTEQFESDPLRAP